MRRPRASRRGRTPRAASISMLRACTPTARDSVVGCARASTTRTGTPWRANWQAAVSPTGPAPTTSTSSVAVMVISSVAVRLAGLVQPGVRSSGDGVGVGFEGPPHGDLLLPVEVLGQRLGVRAGAGLVDVVQRGVVGEQGQRRRTGDPCPPARTKGPWPASCETREGCGAGPR